MQFYILNIIYQNNNPKYQQHFNNSKKYTLLNLLLFNYCTKTR